MEEELEQAVARGSAQRDGAHMAPTIAYFSALQQAHPEVPELVHELAGAHDTAGEESTARGSG